jgi:hypothetical protein
VHACKVRVHQLKRRKRRIATARRAGTSSAAYCRTAGIPAISYGWDVCGVANTPLRDVRALIARTASPDTYGRSVDLVFHALDAAGVRIDPAYEAHVLPIMRWAIAWWEQWVPPSALQRAYVAAVHKLGRSDGRAWQNVAGPVAAMVASAWRLGWHVPSARRLVDDVGTQWDLLHHSPAAVGAAVKRSVSRWRMRKICVEFPALANRDLDCCQAHPETTACAANGIVIDLSHAIGPLLRGANRPCPHVPLWEPSCRHWLTSAIAGGQWVQMRRAAVPSWDADRRCQLCLDADGTLEHRRHCAATLPADGWAAPPGAMRTFIDRLGPDRARLLRTRALLVMRVVPPPRSDVAQLRWLTPTPDVTRRDVRWFIDGSVVDAKWPELAVATAAIVVVCDDGSLVAYAEALLPPTVLTAAAAEAHGLMLAVQCSVCTPRVVTDCRSLLTTADAGSARATAASKTLAGIWTIVVACLDGDLTRLIAEGLLRWMPAHKSCAQAVRQRASDGELVTVGEWRANRFADAIARSCAYRSAVPRPTAGRLQFAADVLRTEAGTLGAVTKAANRHRSEVVTDGGHRTFVTRRDSVRPERPAYVAARPWRKRIAHAPPDPKPLRPRVAPPPPPAQPRHFAQAAARATSAALRRDTRAANDFAIRQIVAERARSATPQAVPAADRRAALRTRVAAREAASAACTAGPVS